RMFASTLAKSVSTTPAPLSDNSSRKCRCLRAEALMLASRYIYEWAGQLRTIRIGKGGNWFCYPEYIQPHLEKMFARLKQLNHLKGLNRQAFSRKAAHILAEINAVHPFREGNGRTQLVFLMLLVEQAGFSFDADVLTRNRVLRAMIDSFSGAEEPLAALILDIISDHPKPGA
ncbi:Fic/DOC family protein, partial [Pannonibacter carbonis]|uniref:Fic/DOC family protein n=1 Tax=Pannonibacter carbonis TaxID=2067569 RepID=UPI000D0FE4A9